MTDSRRGAKLSASATTTKPHFSSTRREASLSAAAWANSGRSSSSARSAVSACGRDPAPPERAVDPVPDLALAVDDEAQGVAAVAAVDLDRPEQDLRVAVDALPVLVERLAIARGPRAGTRSCPRRPRPTRAGTSPRGRRRGAVAGSPWSPARDQSAWTCSATSSEIVSASSRKASPPSASMTEIQLSLRSTLTIAGELTSSPNRL